MKLCGFEAALDQPLFLIAGPCVIESRELLVDTAGRLKETVQRVQAADVIASSPAEFAALIARDHAKWTPVIREGNIRAE